METANIHFPLLHLPGNLGLFGASFSGKTSILCKLIKYKEQLFTKPPKHIVYCSAEEPGPLFNDLQDITFYRGLPDQATLDIWISMYEQDGWCLIFDDLSEQLFSSSSSQEVITRMGHHHQCFIIVVGHCLLNQGPRARLASLNFHYFILTRTVRDVQTISRFGSQVMGNKNGKYFLEAFLDATEIRPDGSLGYILVTTHPIFSRRDMLLYSHIMPDDGPLVVYKVV